MGALAGLCVIVVAIARSTAPAQPQGYGEDYAQVVVDACVRARGGVGRDECRCAYERIAATVPWERAVTLEEELRGAAELPEDIRDLVDDCWHVDSGP